MPQVARASHQVLAMGKLNLGSSGSSADLVISKDLRLLVGR
ncbi:hypothetical protein AM1_1346 [Acaryochloris marina MBIC11017]|uniref:Uncharacterized protein n=1 Tax=Acaryochloris marina (strain MBIC 11017) TaxID=329726 RepID=B0C6F7_ACAM1|nr:hypothetical protein AM1_1346 [Acaryochloris marina MBIC11017]